MLFRSPKRAAHNLSSHKLASKSTFGITFSEQDLNRLLGLLRLVQNSVRMAIPEKVSLFLLVVAWYLGNTGYNIYNKKALNLIHAHWTVAFAQLIVRSLLSPDLFLPTLPRRQSSRGGARQRPPQCERGCGARGRSCDRSARGPGGGALERRPQSSLCGCTAFWFCGPQQAMRVARRVAPPICGAARGVRILTTHAHPGRWVWSGASSCGAPVSARRRA